MVATTEVARGEIWWADLGEPRGAAPAARRPVIVVQADAFSRSAVRTVVVTALTSNLRLAAAPGNVLVPATQSGLPRDSVANVSQVATVDRGALTERVGQLPARVMRTIDDGLRIVLAL